MTERRLLQISVAVAALVPIYGGFLGAFYGVEAFDAGAVTDRAAESHAKYLSGLLLAIGFAFWSAVPRIETEGVRFRLLAAVIVVGGFARLASLMTDGVPPAPMLFALFMELGVTPALALWRERVERLTPTPAPAAR